MSSVAPHTSHVSAKSRSTTSLRPLQMGFGGISLIGARRFQPNEMPPKRATNGGFLGPRFTRTSSTLYVPSFVRWNVCKRRWILRQLVLNLMASVRVSDDSITHFSLWS